MCEQEEGRHCFKTLGLPTDYVASQPPVKPYPIRAQCTGQVPIV